tara:strand:- start:415 stop:573 length:159 start_codon:yes stop_codon:yes gene_type:complete
LAFDKQLKRVDFPTLGNPTIPAFMVLNFWQQKYTNEVLNKPLAEISLKTLNI